MEELRHILHLAVSHLRHKPEGLRHRHHLAMFHRHCRPEELEFAAEGSVKGIVRQEEFLGFYRQYYVETMNHEHIIVRTDRNIKVEAGKEVQLRVK